MTRHQIAPFLVSILFFIGIFPAKVFAANTISDKWVFFGDSITNISIGQGAPTFAARVHSQLPNVTIIQINEGIGGLGTTSAITPDPITHIVPIDDALSRNSDTKYFTLSLGSNDTGGDGTVCYMDSTQVPVYANFVTMVQKVLNAGKVPVVPTIPSATQQSCGVEVNALINNLYTNFPQVVKGPDLWAAFSNRPDLFPDIHPNAAGVDAYNQVWADWAAQNIYSGFQSAPTPTPGGPIPTPIPHQWQNIDIPGVSNDFNNPSNNYGYNSVVVDQTSPNIVYVGTNYQGLYKSTNSGATWIKIDTGTGASLVDGGRIWSLAIDPFNHTTIYAASGYGYGGPLKSTDGGISWINTLSNTSPTEQTLGTNDIYNVAVDPYTPNHILASFHYYWLPGSSDTGVVESTNGGTSWTIHYPPSGAGWGAGNSVWFLSNSSTWLLGSQNAGYWRTTNSGTSWTQVSPNSIAHGGINSLYRDTTTGVLYAGYWHGIMKSMDNGVNWTDFSTGLPYAGFESIISDGTNLYSAPSAPYSGDYPSAHGPWYTTTLSGSAWTGYNSQQPCDTTNNVCNGPVMMARDTVSNLVYSVNWLGGVWRLSTGNAINADLNGDTKVNALDFGAMASHWGSSDAASDLDHNGTVDFNDVSILLARWAM